MASWPTSLVPMPNASEPRPRVDVWLSPQTMVMPAGEALFRHDHVDDAAIVRGHVEQLDAVLGAVACQRGDLCLGGGAA